MRVHLSDAMIIDLPTTSGVSKCLEKSLAYYSGSIVITDNFEPICEREISALCMVN